MSWESRAAPPRRRPFQQAARPEPGQACPRVGRLAPPQRSGAAAARAAVRSGGRALVHGFCGWLLAPFLPSFLPSFRSSAVVELYPASLCLPLLSAMHDYFCPSLHKPIFSPEKARRDLRYWQLGTCLSLTSIIKLLELFRKNLHSFTTSQIQGSEQKYADCVKHDRARQIS